jgi:glycerol-3-phosphate acyltransferase PlsX
MWKVVIYLMNKSDVIVCDGFTGNVVLKQAEAFYTLIRKRKIKDEYFDRFNYENYGGTPVLGINSTVMIGHGISNEIAVKNMIITQKDVVEANFRKKLNTHFNNDKNYCCYNCCCWICSRLRSFQYGIEK